MGSYADRRRAQSAPQVESDGFSFLETLKSVPGDFKELAGGLGALLSTIGNDVYGAAREAVGQESDFLLDDMAKQAVYNWEGQNAQGLASDALRFATNPLANPRVGRVFKDDISARYGPLLPGGPEAGQTTEALEKDPLAFLLDAADVATLGGTAAAGVANRVSRVGRVADDLADLARGSSNVSRTAKAVDKVIPGRKYQIVGQDVPLGGSATAMDPLTGRMRTKDFSTNPLRRTLREQPRWNRNVESVDALDERIRMFDEMIDSAEHGDEVTDWTAERDLLKGLRDRARGEGVTQILKPKKAEASDKLLAQRIANEGASFYYGNRDKVIGAHLKALKKADLPTEDKLRTLLGFREQPGPRASFDEVEASLAEVIEDSPRLARIQEVVAPWVQRVRQMEEEFADVENIRQVPLGKRVEDDFITELRKAGRFNDTPVGVRHLDALDATEQAALDERLRLAANIEIDSAKRFIEVVGGEPLAAAKQGIEDGVTEMLDDTRLLNLEKEASVLLKTGRDFTSLFEQLYKPLRVKHFVEEGLATLEEAPSAKELDDLRRVQQLKAPAYYPQSSRLSQKNSDYILKNSTWGATKKAQPKSFRQNRGKNMEIWLRENKDAFEVNPEEAYSRMAAEVTGYETILRQMDRLKQEFGIRISSREELPSSYRIINPEATRLLFHKHRDVQLKSLQGMAKGMDETDALREAFLSVFDDVSEDDLARIFASKNEVFAVPKVVADSLTEQMNWSLPPAFEKVARFSWDGYMKMWRDITLYLRGGFYLNNIVGNAVFLNLQGGKLRKVAQQVDKSYRKKAQEVIEKLGATDDVETGMLSTALMRSTSLEPYRGTRHGDAAIRITQSKAAKVAGSPIRGGQRLNGVIENAFRRESFLTAAEKDIARRGAKLTGNRLWRSKKRLDSILTYGAANPDAVKRWIDDLDDTMNNYANQSPFVRKIVRRFMAPFWPFYWHSGKKLITLPLEHSLKATVLDKLHLMNEEYVQDTIGLVPDYLETARPVGEGDQEGETRFINPKAMNPLQGVTDNPINLLGPVLQTGIENLTGRDLYMGDKFSSPDVRVPFGQEQAYDEQGNPVTVRPIVDAPLETLLGQFPMYSTVRNLTSGGARYDTGEVIEDEQGNPRYPTDRVYELLRWFGIPLTDYNVGRYQAEEGERRRQARASFGP